MRQTRSQIERRLSALEKGKKAKQAMEGQMDNQGQMIRLTGLWQRAGILSGGLSPSAKLVILPNTHKRSSSDPDAIAYLQAPAASSQAGPAARPAEEPEAEQQEFWWEK